MLRRCSDAIARSNGQVLDRCVATLVGCWILESRFDLVRADGGATAFAAAVVFDLVFHADGLLVAVGAAADACRLARSLCAASVRAVDGLCCGPLLRCAGVSAGILGADCSVVVAGTLRAGCSGVVAGTLGFGCCSLVIDRVCTLVMCCTFGDSGATALAC